MANNLVKTIDISITNLDNSYLLIVAQILHHGTYLVTIQNKFGIIFNIIINYFIGDNNKFIWNNYHINDGNDNEHYVFIEHTKGEWHNPCGEYILYVTSTLNVAHTIFTIDNIIYNVNAAKFDWD